MTYLYVYILHIFLYLQLIKIENPYIKEKRQCILCRLGIEPDYKNVRLLSQFQSRYTGRVYGRHITGLCKHKQMRLEQEITKAQSSGTHVYINIYIYFFNSRNMENRFVKLQLHTFVLHYRFNGLLDERTRIC